MAKLESYSNLAKQQEDLIKKGFCFGQLFALGIYSKTPQGINFKSSFKQTLNADNQSDTSALAYLNYKSDSLSIKDELSTKKITKLTVEYTPEAYKQVKDKFEVERNEIENTTKATFSAELTQDKYKAKVALTNDVAVKLSGVYGINQGGIGVDLAYDLNSSRLTAYNAAAFWFTDKYRVVLKHTGTDKKQYKLGTIGLSGLYHWSDKIKVAGLVNVEASKEPNFTLGAQYETQDNRIVKARFDNDALLGISIRSRVNKYFTLVTATQFKVTELAQPHFQFGLRLKVNQ